MDDFEQELKSGFLEECGELLESAESAFLRLESDRDDPELLNEIFRLAHNLKGSSKAVGFDQLGELTHIAENLILKLKEGQLEVTDSVVSVLLSFKDKVDEMISGLIDDYDKIFQIDEMINQLKDITEAKQIDDNDIKINENIEEQLPPASEDFAFQDDEHSKEPQVDLVDETIPVVEEKVASTPVITTKDKKVHKKEDENIRVKLSRIDKLTDIIGELVILQTVLGQRRYEFIHDDVSNKSIGHMAKLFKEAQELTMSLRMLPVKSTFQKMSRIVRDTSMALDKKVKLEIRGEDTEVDKTVLERLSDPLVHMIRNAVDHGLETPDERKKSGKPSEGIVELMAYHEGSNLVIQITDDGKGIDPRVIEAKAIEKGVLTENSGLTDHDIIQLVFHAGFSTKEQVTEVSGRGVGMDVVKTNIESLGGEVKLMSKIGKGSSFKIVLPLTLAIIDGIVISSKKEKFVIPLSQVFELTNIKTENIEVFSGDLKLIKLRGEVMPLFHINNKLGIKIDQKDSQIVVVVRGLSHTFGVVVEDILNQQQIVIKKVGEDIRGQKGIIGSAIMGDGKPAFILDIFELFKDDLKQSKSHQKLKRNKNIAA